MRKIFALLFFCLSFSYAQPQIPKLQMWATDLTSTLSKSELDYLNSELKAYQDTTSNQLLVLMIPSLEGYPIEMLAEETASENKIGTKKFDNGILLLIAKDDRELRIEVGYGLEGAVPDAIASSIIRNVIVPKFKDGDYFEGIKEGIKSIKQAIGGEYVGGDTNSDEGFPFFALIFIFILIWLIFGRKRGPFIPGGIYRTGTHYGGWSSGSSSSSWGGGGGFSGGGGSFGGGGASGSW